ncbi:MAG: EF-P beta-lysylation protein EpmB [Acidobacteriota bacterium]
MGGETRARPPLWQRLLADGVRDLDTLLGLLDLDPDAFETFGGPAYSTPFPTRVPRGFVARMAPRDPEDPLLLQVLPVADEHRITPGFADDPLDEAAVNPVPGLLHKYRGRALLVVTGACAVHCRYCFRRHFPYTEQRSGDRDWSRALVYLGANPSIEEVILSGGDPLSLTDTKLARLADGIAAIPHVRRLRIHSRLPVVLPDRIDDAFLAWFADRSRWRPVMVIHANHPNELDASVASAIGRLRSAGVTVLNQTVLLRRVNDDVRILEKLSEALFESGVMPYYLHTLDPVQGAAHFALRPGDAQRLAWDLAKHLPGYLVPRLVTDVPGAPAKVPVPIGDGQHGTAHH